MADPASPPPEPLIKRIARYSPCSAAVAWLGSRTLTEAWAECERGDWMLWLAGRVGIDRRSLVRAAVECARPALKHVKPGEDRPWYVLEVALAWCDGRATLAEVRAAVVVAYAYAVAAAVDDAAASSSAADAAYAAAVAADEDADAMRRYITVEMIEEKLNG